MFGEHFGDAFGSHFGALGPVIEMARRLLVTSLDGLVLNRTVPLDAIHAPTLELDGLYVREEPQ